MKQKNIISFIIYIFLIILFLSLTGCSSEEKKQENNVIIQSDDETFQISMPENIEIKFYNDENYSLDLFSENDNFYLYANTIYKNREVDLLNYVKDDKEYIISSKENTRDSSDIVLLSIDDYNSYTYSFIYTDIDFGKDFYTQVVWIETSSKIYILNFEIIIDNKDKYTEIINNIITSFIEIQ